MKVAKSFFHHCWAKLCFQSSSGGIEIDRSPDARVAGFTSTTLDAVITSFIMFLSGAGSSLIFYYNIIKTYKVTFL